MKEISVKRIEELMRRLPETLDAALITGESSVAYYTGAELSQSLLMVTRAQSIVLTREPYKPCTRAMRNLRDVQDVQFVFTPGDPLRAVPGIVRSYGIRVLGVEAEQISVDALRRLQEAQCCEMDASGLLDGAIYDQRRRKTPQEIQDLQLAQDIADKMFTEVQNYVRAGMTDRELQMIIGLLLRDFGSQRASFDHVTGVGVNTAFPHVRPSGEVIHPGDFVMLDVGASVNGTGSDMTRMIAVQYADDRKREIYDIVLRAQTAGRAAVKLGARCCDVDEAARRVIEQAGYGENYLHGLGHTIDLSGGAAPRFNRYDETALFPHLIMTVEPGIYLPGEFGVRIEDMLYIGENEVVNMTHSTHALVVVP